MKKCISCCSKKEILSFPYDCHKKKVCLFSKYDHLLAEIYFEYFNKKITEEDLNFFSKKIQESFIGLKNKIENLRIYYFPTNENDFIGILKQFNYELFYKTNIQIFGKFRDKDIYFDTDHHQMKGSTPDKIEPDLKKLYKEYLQNLDISSCSKDIYLRKCALFLETFFRIHPFPDGNGRVGRLFLILMGVSSQKYFFERFDMHGEDDKDYLNALRYAHKNYNHPDPQIRGKSHTPLIKWLNLKISNKYDFSGEEEPPQSYSRSIYI